MAVRRARRDAPVCGAMIASASRQKPKNPARAARQVSGGFHWMSFALSLLREPKVGMANKTYGTVSPEQQKEMSGLEFVEGLAIGHDRADIGL